MNEVRASANRKTHRALVLGGGGARGEFQLGAVAYLAEQGCEFDFFTGVGQGALNAAVLAQYPSLREGVKALSALWEAARDSAAVYAMPAGGIALNALLALFAEAGVARDGVFGAEPLRRLIAQHVRWDRLLGSGKTLAFGVTSLSDGGYHVVSSSGALLRANARPAGGKTGFALTLEPGRLGSIPDRFTELVLATVSLPLLFPPVDLYGQRLVDAGARRPGPLALALAHAELAGCAGSSVTAISTSPADLSERPAAALQGGSCLVARLLEVVNHDALDLDAVAHASAPARLCSLWPELDLPLGALDFDDREGRSAMRSHGWAIAERALDAAALTALR